MTDNGCREVTVTKDFPARLGDKVRQHLWPVIFLSVAVFSILPGPRTSLFRLGRANRRCLMVRPRAAGQPDGEWRDVRYECHDSGTPLSANGHKNPRHRAPHWTSLVVTVNDRLPSRRRVLDLSVGAARALGIAGQGLAMVELTPASPTMLVDLVDSLPGNKLTPPAGISRRRRPRESLPRRTHSHPPDPRPVASDLGPRGGP